MELGLREYHEREIPFCEKQLVWWTKELETVNKKRLPEARKEDREFVKWADERGYDYGGKYIGEDTEYLLKWRRKCYKWRKYYAEQIEYHKQKLAEYERRAKR